MKKVYENKLSEFIFHDAWVQFISYDEAERALTLAIKDVTLISGNKYIDKATMIFNGLDIHELCYPGCSSIFKDGEIISVNEPSAFADDKIGELIANLKKQVQILDVEKEADGYYFSFDVINDRFFNCTLSFKRAVIEWEE